MPITTFQARHRRRDRFSWYPIVEAVWAITAVLVAIMCPSMIAPTEISIAAALLTGVVLVPAPMFLLVRCVAAVAELRGGAR